MSEELRVGFWANYINDYGFEHITDLPAIAAFRWVREVVPSARFCEGTTKQITEMGWTNKAFIIVGQEQGALIALYNHDGVFSVRRQRLNKAN